MPFAFLPRVGLLLFGSGLCALVYQVAWLRLLRQIFGGSTAASATAVAIFMAGLGLGGLILGRYSEKKANPLGFYATLETGVSLLAATSVPLMFVVRWLYLGLGGTETLGVFGGTLLRLALASLVLGVPTFLMGGTLPATVRAVTSGDDTSRHSVGLLYAANTAGAVCGALIANFWMLELLGIRQTVWLAAALNLLIALAAKSASRTRTPMAIAAPDQRTDPAAVGASALSRLVLFAAAVVGFVFFLQELVWYRMMSPILGGSTYTFGIVLAVALAGIGLGGLVYGLRGRGRAPTTRELAATCALEAIAISLPLALGDRLAYLALQLRGFEAAGFGALALGWTVVTAIVVLPAATIAGYQFPLLVGLLGQGRERLATQVGQAYAWNTLGSIVGSIAGGFGLIPLLTATGSWRLSAWLLAALSLGFLAHDWRARKPLAGPGLASLGALAAAMIAVALTLAPGPSAFWRHAGIGAGRQRATMTSPNEIRDARHQIQRSVVWEQDGRESSVALVAGSGLSFIVNGKSDGNARTDAPTQVMSGLVGAALHPDPRTALVIGLGTGSSSGWLAEVESIERVDTVELEPAILRVAADCAPVNHNVLEHPKVEIVVGDAREFLLATKRSYDIVFSEPSNPYRAGIASLFTREYYRAAAAALAEDGLFLQWLQAYEIDAQLVRTAYATMQEVFPSVETWLVHSQDLLLVASQKPIVHDAERIRELVRKEPFASALRNAWGVSDLEGFYVGHLATPALARAIASSPLADINTDDRPLIEFGFARKVGRSSHFRVDDLQRLAQTRSEHRPLVHGLLDWQRVEEMREARQLTLGALAFEGDNAEAGSTGPSGPESDGGETTSAHGLRSRARRAYAQNDLAGAHRLWFAQLAEPVAPIDLVLAAESAADQNDERALELVERLRAEQPVAADAILALWSMRQNDPASAARSLSRSLEAYRIDPWAPMRMMRRTLRLAPAIASASSAEIASVLDSLSLPFAVAVHEEDRRLLRLIVAQMSAEPGDCVAALQDFEPAVPWTESFLAQRVSCYQRAGHPALARAEDDLAAFLARSEVPLGRGLESPRAPQPLELDPTSGDTSALAPER